MRAVIRRLFEVVFGCRHRLTFPMTRRGTHFTYQTCVRCGAEFDYDWKTMSRGHLIDRDAADQRDHAMLPTHPKAA